MTNFNEKINSRKKFFLFADGYDYFIERVGSVCQLEREFDYRLKVLKGGCRLFIQYKNTCRVQKMAGKCFMWAYTSKTIGSYDVRRLCLDRDGIEDLDNFGNPRFEYISGAVLISDKDVCTYGDTWFEAVDLKKNHVSCKAYVCGRFVSEFKIPQKTFDRLFGLKENFPKQYEKVFGKAEDAKPVQEENDPIEEVKQVEEENDPIEKAKRSIELCKNSLFTNKYRLEKAVCLLQGALEDFDVKRHELDDMLDKLTQKEERREERRWVSI